jgi:GDPmannose 4,6-dehydratase
LGKPVEEKARSFDMTKKIAALTGITGQVGSQLARKLLNDNYKVYGMIRKNSSFNIQRIEDIYSNNDLELVYGDLSDTSSINAFIHQCKPEYLFNLGAMSHVRTSFSLPEYVMDVDGTGVVRCLEAIKNFSPTTKFMQFSTSELFGSSPAPQSETTLMKPCSPYGFAKLAGYWATINYRVSYNLQAYNGIFFNMESKFRDPTFLTRKCTQGAARIYYGLQKELFLGNLDAERSWNYVGDNNPDDYVIGDNKKITVKEWVNKVFTKLGMDWQNYVRSDSRYFRPQEVNSLEPDSAKLKKEFGWSAEYSVDDIIDEMLAYDLELARKEKVLKDHE